MTLVQREIRRRRWVPSVRHKKIVQCIDRARSSLPGILHVQSVVGGLASGVMIINESNRFLGVINIPPMTSRYLSRDSSRPVVVGVVVIATLYFARVVVIPLALAMLFTFLLTPMVQLLERARLGRVVSTLLVVLIAAIAVGAVGWTVTKEFADVVNQLPNYQANIKEKIDSLHWLKSQTLNNASTTMNEIGHQLAAPPASPEQRGGKQAGTSTSASQRRPLPVEVVQSPSLPFESVQNVLMLLGTALIVVVFTIFMLVRREDLRNRFISLAGQGKLNVMTQALDEAGDRVSRYLRMQLVVNACYGLLVGTALDFIGVPGALLWGAIVGILRFLPYIGPPLGAVMPVVLSLAVFHGWTRPFLILTFFIITELVVSNLIEPVLYGAHTGISSIAILVSAIFWTVLWGPIGLVLATPLTVCLVVIGKHVPQLSFLQVLLGDEPVLTPDAHYYQRLLAMDHHEAKQVLEGYLKEKPLEELYDAVLIPALMLAEQDRHRDDLDETTTKFICQSTNELIEELGEQWRVEPTARALDTGVETPEKARNGGGRTRSRNIVCLPARDEADEVVATMLAQLLERAGHQAHCIPLGTSVEMVAQIAQHKPDMVCVSALPPFAIAHARALYAKLHAQSPNLDILVGLWNFAGDTAMASRRIGISEGGRTFTMLSQIVQQVGLSSRLGTVPAGQTNENSSGGSI